MHLFANIPSVDAIACNLHNRSRSLFPVAHSNAQRFCSSSFRSNATAKRLTLRGSDFTPKCIEVFVAYLNIIERSNQLRVLLETSGELLTGKVVRAFYFALL